MTIIIKNPDGATLEFPFYTPYSIKSDKVEIIGSGVELKSGSIKLEMSYDDVVTMALLCSELDDALTEIALT